GDILQAELRYEMRPVTDRVNRTFEYKTRYRSFYRNDRDCCVRRRRRIGPAHNAQNTGAFTVPTCGGGHPFLAAVDHPVVPLSLGRRADALAGRRRGSIGTTARFARAEPGKRRTTCLQKRYEQPLALVRRTAEQYRQQT